MPDDKTERPTCFIAMPITTPEDRVEAYGGEKDHFRHVMNALFIPAIEAAGYEAVPPEAKASVMIQPGIIRSLLDAPLVLCDMSALNANVFFELGVRTSLNKPVVMVRDHLTPKIPFDINSIGAHEYDGTLSGWRLDDEREKLTAYIGATAANGDHNELWRYFGIRDVATEPPPGSDMDRIVTMLSELLAQRSPSLGDLMIEPMRRAAEELESLLAVDRTVIVGDPPRLDIHLVRGLSREASTEARNQIQQILLQYPGIRYEAG